jgi:hypothetical protein
VVLFDTRTAPDGTEWCYSIRGQRQMELSGAFRYGDNINW